VFGSRAGLYVFLYLLLRLDKQCSTFHGVTFEQRRLETQRSFG